MGRRYFSLIIMMLVPLLVAVGCSNGEPPDLEERNSLGLGEDSTEVSDDAVVYAQTIDRALDTMEDPELPPLQLAIDDADTQAIQQINRNWSAALKIIEQASPPEEAADYHTQLVNSMRRLESWNTKIAAASKQGKSKVKKVAKQAQNSQASTDFGNATQQLEVLGYFPPAEGQEEEFDSFTEGMDTAPIGQ